MDSYAPASGQEERDAPERLKIALAASHSGTFRWEISTDYLELDEALDTLLGTSEEFTPSSLSGLLTHLHPDDRGKVAERFQRCADGVADLEIEFRAQLPDGHIRSLYSRGKTFFDELGRPDYVTGSCVDITERVRVEALRIAQSEMLELALQDTTLQEALDRLVRTVEAQSTDGMLGSILFVEDGKLRHGAAPSLPEPYNRAIDGIAIGEGVGSCGSAAHRRAPVYVSDIATDPLWADFRELALAHGLRACWSTPIRFGHGKVQGTFAMYYRAPREPTPTDIELVELVIRSAALVIEHKRSVKALADLNQSLEQRIALAVLENAKTEEKLHQAQKMEAVGKLTGGVAHDFNNVLQIISGNLQLMGRDVAGNERASRRLNQALNAVSRGSKLVSHLLSFARRQPLEPAVTNIGRLVQGMDEMLRRALGEAIELETVIAGGLWNAFTDAAQLENALLNLAINARDAMGGRGKLTVEAGNASLDDYYAAAHSEVKAGQYVMLAVTDTGCGIPAEMIDHVFEPFFTTKPEGQGSGLGLSMVYGFVKQSNGHVKIYSEPGHGTTIKIYLPRTLREEAAPLLSADQPATGGSEAVLVVEDDDEVRLTVVEMLSDLGYRVFKARNADAALAVIESGIAIDVLFTDVVMPGTLRAPDLARRAKERLPKLAVLFTSGYTENSIIHGGRLDEGVHLLSKPYTREELANKIRSLLA